MIKSILFTAVSLLLMVAAAPVSPGYEVGDTVTDFKLKNTDGKMVALSDYKNSKGAIVIFDCNTCPYSQKYNSRIIALNEKYAPKGFPLIAIQPNDPEISPGDSYEYMVKLANKKKYQFPYLFDETQIVAKNFGANYTPHVFVLKKEGVNFKVAYIGAIDDYAKDEAKVSEKYVERVVDNLLIGKELPFTKTKILGCSIKWKES